MDQLSLFNCLQVGQPVLVSFYGAGGKTSLMLRLAGELAARGRKTLVTTTTKIFPPSELPLFLDGEPAELVPKLREHFYHSGLAVLGSRITPDGKLAGIPPDRVGILADELKVNILVEADGSKGRPLKGYRDYEPVIPERSNLVAAVIGGDALGRPVDDQTVHRPVDLLKALGTGGVDSITEEILARAFELMLALGKNQAPGAKAFFILNKADLLEDPGKTALNLARHLVALNHSSPRLLLTESTADNPVLFNLAPAFRESAVSVSCVLMAAGSSNRMGRDKLVLPLGGRTVFENTLDAVEKTGFNEIIVVIRPGSALEKLPALCRHRVIVNEDHQRGMSTSLRAGITAVDSRAQGVLFALADQPLITTALYRKMIAIYRRNLKQATFPVHRGRRGNPVLFDRRTWPELANLEGDRGGRAVLQKLLPSMTDPVQAGDTSIFTDIDTPEDYRVLEKHFSTRRS